MKSAGRASSGRQGLHHQAVHFHTRRAISLRSRSAIAWRTHGLGSVLETHASISRLLAVARAIRMLRRYRTESQRPAAGRLGALCQQEERLVVKPEPIPATSSVPAQTHDPARELQRVCASLATTTERLAHDMQALAGTILALAPLLEARLEPGMRQQETPVHPVESGQPAAQRDEHVPGPPGPLPDPTQPAAFASGAVEAPPVRFIPRPVRLNRRGASSTPPGARYRMLAW